MYTLIFQIITWNKTGYGEYSETINNLLLCLIKNIFIIIKTLFFPVDISILVKYLKEAILKQLNSDTSTAALKIKFTS